TPPPAPSAKSVPPPPPQKTPAPEAKAAKEANETAKLPLKEKAPKATAAEPRVGPVIVGPVIVAKPAVIVPYVRRFEAICGSGDATISVASFGGTLHLKKL